ncbi:hypothetical protein GEMRC1_006384 [Eukaryota sp. GEM-RC1]
MRFLPANATDLYQPCDSFIIAKLKEEWKRLWGAKKLELIENKLYAEGSGKIKNPGKKLMLDFAKEAVDYVNSRQDASGISFARKSMIRCGLSLDVVGRWQISQLYPQRQEIMRKYRPNFDGLPSLRKRFKSKKIFAT